MRIHHLAIRLAAALLVGLSAVAAEAAPDEIQVYTEEMDDPGEFGLELHVNQVLRGATAPEFDGEMKSEHRLQLTPEFSYGISKTLEAGLYLPAAVGADGNLVGNGMRLRLKYIAPREEHARLFWGLNGELGHFARRVSESSSGMELRPIVGYRDATWLVSFNPILDADLSSKVSREPKFEPALKLTRKAGARVNAGFEYYGEYGPIFHRLPASERAHYLFAVADVEVKNFDVNIGIGHGLQAAADKWTAKAIIAFPFK